ncbi:MAG: YggS family pyridoxal phosphate-dependent enzyme [Verrucomicrobiae bacterium]|nr:YggS family pyridoxal phosphate-dependent enzyme [Verrucomicrobiae bacterium]NNJ41921.1 YggS family pyridoxal phosphate-dependent enzyme [Akkermansiaceae bacterium]
MFNGASERLLEVRRLMGRAAARSGRADDACELLVVSKTWPAAKVAEVVSAGHLCFGENKVQEAAGKIPALSSMVTEDLHWHLIGHLQRNKVRKALGLFDTLHSIDSIKLARYTSNIAGELGKKPNVYLQVDLAGEERKNGYAADALRRDLDDLLSLENVSIIGLMCIPPAATTPEDARPWFAQLRELRDDLEVRAGVLFPGLSMGMSGDFEVAIEEGSTIVRVGSAIFGQRDYT